MPVLFEVLFVGLDDLLLFDDDEMVVVPIPGGVHLLLTVWRVGKICGPILGERRKETWLLFI